METIMRDDLHQSADAARALDRAVISQTNIISGNTVDVIESYDSEEDAPFLIVLVDTAGERFSVEGPMIDATEWVNVVRLAQSLGDRVVCFVKAGAARFQAARLTKEIRQYFGYRHVAAGSILRPRRLKRLIAMTA